MLDYWEKERGVDKNFLIQSLEKGLLTVYRKKAHLPENIRIKIDPETGDIKFINEKNEEIPPPTFPWERIAAQAAKQVLIQKIREKIESSVNVLRLEGRKITAYAVSKHSGVAYQTVLKYKNYFENQVN